MVRQGESGVDREDVAAGFMGVLPNGCDRLAGS
jgi:hypothetical protein